MVEIKIRGLITVTTQCQLLITLIASFFFYILACTRQLFNLAFLMDGSASIKSLSSEDTSQYKGLVKSVINFYNVSEDALNVGVVVYSTNSITQFRFDKYYTKSEVNAAIDAIVFPGEFTRAGNGLTAVRNELFANGRSGIPNFLVVLMDGVSIDDISIPSAFFRAMDVYVLAVGIGDFYAKPQLDEIANDPDSAYVFEASSYDMLPTLATRIKASICNGNVIFHWLAVVSNSYYYHSFPADATLTVSS